MEDKQLSYEETMESVRELLSLGYSFSQAITTLENNCISDEKAIEELRRAQEYGI